MIYTHFKDEGKETEDTTEQTDTTAGGAQIDMGGIDLSAGIGATDPHVEGAGKTVMV